MRLTISAAALEQDCRKALIPSVWLKLAPSLSQSTCKSHPIFLLKIQLTSCQPRLQLIFLIGLFFIESLHFFTGFHNSRFFNVSRSVFPQCSNGPKFFPYINFLSKFDLNIYRRVSILSCGSKIIERVVVNNLWLTKFKILSECHYDLRPKHSTAIEELIENIRLLLGRKTSVPLTRYLDLKRHSIPGS